MDEEGIRFELIALRNKLFRDRRPTAVLEDLRRLRMEVAESSGPMRRVWLLAMDNAIRRLNEDDRVGAGYELNFVHNLPLSSAQLEGWNDEHFFEFEVPEYLDRVDSVSIRNAIKALGEDLLDLEMGKQVTNTNDKVE